MLFILPAKYTMETAPKPKDPNVRLVEIPERVLAVHKFSGVADNNMVREKQAYLLSLLEKDKVRHIDNFTPWR